MREERAKEIVIAWHRALNERSFGVARDLFADDAEVRLAPVPGARYVGKNEIENWIQWFSTDNFQIRQTAEEFSGNILRWSFSVSSDRFTQLGLQAVDGFAEATFQDAQIQTLRITMSAASQDALQEALDRESIRRLA